MVDMFRLLAVHNLRQYLQELAYHSHQVVGEEDQQWEHWEPRDHSVVREKVGGEYMKEEEMRK